MRSMVVGVLAAAAALWAAPVLAQTRTEKSHLVYVARQHDDGRLTDETQIRCDLSLSCSVEIRLGAEVASVYLRVFAEDGGGFSVVPTGSDQDGNQAIGRRCDVGWGPGRTAMAIVPVRPLKPAGENEVTMFGLVVREDLAPVAQIVVAVKELRPFSATATN